MIGCDKDLRYRFSLKVVANKCTKSCYPVSENGGVGVINACFVDGLFVECLFIPLLHSNVANHVVVVAVVVVVL